MRSQPRFRQILRRILIAVLAFIGFSFLSVFLFYVVFFHRTSRSNEPQDILYADLCAMVPNGTVDRVSFLSDGKTLNGYFLHPENGDGILVFALGREGKIGDHLEETRAFAEDGWNVLVYYGTGCGASEGSSMVGLAQGKHDLTAALTFLDSSGCLQGESLVIYGHSMGAYATAALTDEFSEIDRVACIAGFETSPMLMISNAKSKVGPLAYAGAPFIYLIEWILFGPDAFDSASESLSSSDIPAILIQFERDPVVPVDADIVTHMNNKKAPGAGLLRLGEPFSDHHDSAILAGSDVLDSVLSFLSECR